MDTSKKSLDFNYCVRGGVGISSRVDRPPGRMEKSWRVSVM